MLFRHEALISGLFVYFLYATEAAKIFFMIPLSSISEKNVYIPLIDELALRGHNVTVATIKPSSYKAKNIKEFQPLANREELLGLMSDPLELRKEGLMMWLTFDPEFEAPSCEKIYQNPDFQAAINQKYDLIFVNNAFQFCFDAVVHKIGAPFVIVGTAAGQVNLFAAAGLVLPSSFVPSVFIPLSDRMNFWERMANLLLASYWRFFEVYFYAPMGDRVAAKYLGEGLPRAIDIQRNVSLVLSNSNFVINSPVPTLPGIIEVGGMHCRPAKPLPKDLEEFASGATEGLIYFSLGSMINPDLLPEGHIKAFVSVFSKLKQRVLWKLGSQYKIDLPPNVKLCSWCPQQDILGHPNTKLFITHGGLLSTQEAVYHGVPLLGFPIFADQDMNMLVSESKGFAKSLEILTLTEENFMAAVNEILTDARYTQKAKEMSKLYRDQAETPLERAVFWVEYVIRHKGAPHMRSAARDLTLIQYYCLDVIVVLVLAFLTVAYGMFAIVRKTLSLIFGRKQDCQQVRKKKQ